METKSECLQRGSIRMNGWGWELPSKELNREDEDEREKEKTATKVCNIKLKQVFDRP